MTSFFARIREWPRRGPQLRTGADSPLFDREKFTHQIDRKIHPDLNSLLEQENQNVAYAVPDDPFAAKATHMPPPESPHIIPLTPSTRKRSYDTSVLMTGKIYFTTDLTLLIMCDCSGLDGERQ